MLSVLVSVCRATALADQGADAFARRVYAVTKARDLAGYEQLMDPDVTSARSPLRASS
jgi:hypothetical protein